MAIVESRSEMGEETSPGIYGAEILRALGVPDTAILSTTRAVIVLGANRWPMIYLTTFARTGSEGGLRRVTGKWVVQSIKEREADG